MATETYDCSHQGHIWLEEGGKVYVRHRGRPQGKVSVHCAHCSATAELEAHGKFTGRGVGKAVPPSFQKVMARAIETAQANGTEVPTAKPAANPTTARPEADRH